jgi:hypothetical protein
MKRDCFLQALAVVAVAATLASAQKPDTRWYTANPTAKTFTIATANELAGLAVIVNGMWDGTPTRENFSGKTVTLTGNIDLSPYKNWEPIGDFAVNKSNYFSGRFDGGGYKISNLTIDRPNADYQGLFGYIRGGRVGNFGVDKIIVSGRTNVGGVAGTVTDNGLVSKCATNGAVSGFKSNTGGFSKSNTDVDGVGGVVGSVDKKSKVSMSYFAGTVGGTSKNIGGVVGDVNATVVSCYSTGAISGEDNVGGVAGKVNYDGDVMCCYSSGTVNGTGGGIGGVAGTVSRGSVRWSYSIGAVSGKEHVGGVSGRVTVRGGIVKNCYSTGAVDGKYCVGGVAGSVVGEGGFNEASGKVYNCYSTGAVSGGDYVGGVVGQLLQPGESIVGQVHDCAALSSSVTGKTNVGRVAGQRFDTAPALTNNVAYSEMTNNSGDTKWTDRGATAKDGEGISAAAVIIDGTIGGRFMRKDGWLVENGKLPGTGFYERRDNDIIFGDWVKTVNMPPHLHADAADMEAEAVRQKGVEAVKAEAEREKQKKAEAERVKQDVLTMQYGNTVVNIIQNHWRRRVEVMAPFSGHKKLSQKDKNRTLDINFTIRSDSRTSKGKIVDVSVVTSSGAEWFDNMSASIVRQMEGFETPPRREGKCRAVGQGTLRERMGIQDVVCEETFTVRLGPINQ